MNNYIPYMQFIVASKVGDVTGDGIPDWIYLTALKQDPNSPYWINITLHIKNGRTNQTTTLPLTENQGYNPTIWLGDFTGNDVNDIFVAIDSGGSGGIVFGYVYSSIQGRITNIFDSIRFNEQHPYTVNYANNYKVNVKSEKPPKKYILDLQYKGQEYLNEIYHADGTLIQPIEGWVDPASGLYPIDIARKGKYYLQALQQIAGRFHADGLGYVENLLNWDGSQFVIVRQSVAIYGEDLK
ncbi:hypothetical protein SAMN05880501_11572 [Ureibacillus xyleni]|uniref:Uncharacterized protein n=1 Tax=Ureibacillus xyleni TaxID=614648 RepID=A0A285TLM7_9BACL|nr:hypothetical protein [Ureibacillus xyleni]SOC23408.1 hypothetical protein SAMN05880501_11572 [Ureibacillus xyleni]